MLGAGFSATAGLPMAAELWREILSRGLAMEGRAEKFREDLDAYLAFRSASDRVKLTYEEVDLEAFLGFLDIEHHLGLRGKDQWSEQGNEGQIIVKTLIGQVLTERTPGEDAIPRLYLDFARKLRPHDRIITFNYDILLERALKSAGVPFRLFPDRLRAVYDSYAEVDNDAEEVVILKVHGSVDWFDKLPFLELVENAQRLGTKPEHVRDPVFGQSARWTLTQLVDGPRHGDDPLRETYRLKEVEEFYARPPLFLGVPSLISPSTEKLIYTSMVRDFWWGLGQAGVTNMRLVIIGYSLPLHDDYARQVLYRLADNYQSASSDWANFLKTTRDPILVVDKRGDPEGFALLKERYRFIDWRKAELHAAGFDQAIVDRL